MRQLPLPGLEPSPVRLPPVFSTPGTDGAGFTAVEGQLDLFADDVALRRELDQALDAGDFAAARRLRDSHRETYGVAATMGLDFLDVLATTAGVVPAEALCTWEAVDEGLVGSPGLRRRMRDAMFRRLLSHHTPHELVVARPSCLAVVAGVLTREARAAGADSSPDARQLIRDALLAGRWLAPDNVDHDARLADLLMEDLSGPWLACRGAVQRLWPVPHATTEELRAFTDASGPSADDDARGFWQCLTVAETPGCPEAVLHEARRWMKALGPDLHALYMRRARTAP